MPIRGYAFQLRACLQGHGAHHTYVHTSVLGSRAEPGPRALLPSRASQGTVSTFWDDIPPRLTHWEVVCKLVPAEGGCFIHSATYNGQVAGFGTQPLIL